MLKANAKPCHCAGRSTLLDHGVGAPCRSRRPPSGARVPRYQRMLTSRPVRKGKRKEIVLGDESAQRRDPHRFIFKSDTSFRPSAPSNWWNLGEWVASSSFR